MSVKVEGVKEIQKMLKFLNDGVKDLTQLNKKRAESFQKYAQYQGKVGGLNINQITPATQKIQGKFHNPLHNKGDLLSKMSVRANKLYADCGYFSDDSDKPQGVRLTWFKIAVIQTYGYRIPLHGEKGRKVRGFLMAHGIFPRATRKWLIVHPRPFLLNASWKYQASGKDDEIINDFIEDIFKKL